MSEFEKILETAYGNLNTEEKVTSDDVAKASLDPDKVEGDLKDDVEDARDKVEDAQEVADNA